MAAERAASSSSTSAATAARLTARHAIACASRIEHSLGVMAWHCRWRSRDFEQLARDLAMQPSTAAWSMAGGRIRRQSSPSSPHSCRAPPSRVSWAGSLRMSAQRRSSAIVSSARATGRPGAVLALGRKKRAVTFGWRLRAKNSVNYSHLHYPLHYEQVSDTTASTLKPSASSESDG